MNEKSWARLIPQWGGMLILAWLAMRQIDVAEAQTKATTELTASISELKGWIEGRLK